MLTFTQYVCQEVDEWQDHELFQKINGAQQRSENSCLGIGGFFSGFKNGIIKPAASMHVVFGESNRPGYVQV